MNNFLGFKLPTHGTVRTLSLGDEILRDSFPVFRAGYSYCQPDQRNDHAAAAKRAARRRRNKAKRG
ncbi:hypothetical protein TM02_08405 [Aeromonas salmonicida subsp. salmonicida]|uniref:Uncharacterized protein n=1 Tax=Aeromonas salmonicida subsp. salmonicida TaxID=29491 RepID=A0A0F6QDS2_AERSS|nr:hypothetical protein [Aeromonas salmonicida subsp. salmonicida]KIX25532.1 hypothetical protein TM02_08405 [Aeromonas salmonicida subsp. salmonicida]